jgi:acyl-CoA thioesterase-1
MRPARIFCALALGALVVACDSSAPAVPSPVSPVRRVVVLGDSLAVSPSIAESFPAQLQARIDRAGLRWTITNAGVSGDTTADALRRLPPLLTGDVGVLVVALGANDGLDGVDIPVIEQNLSTIVDMARARSVRVLLTGMETPPVRGFGYALAFHNVFPNLAQRYSLPLVPFLLAGVALVPELNGPDGVHPNAAGARRIADTVWPYLEPLLAEMSRPTFGSISASKSGAAAGHALTRLTRPT